MSITGEEYSMRRVKEIEAAAEFWKSFEYDKWKLISFTDTSSARFGWIEKLQYTKYVTIKAHEARFLLGVDADVINQFMLNIKAA